MSDIAALRGMDSFSLSKRPWGSEVCAGRYNESGEKRRRCVDCRGEYSPTSGTQKRCEGCRKGKINGTRQID